MPVLNASFHRFRVALLLPLLLLSCTDATGSSDGEIFISPGGPISLDALGDSVSLRVSQIRGGIPLPVEVQYQSRDSSVVSVSTTGVARSVGGGSTVITAVAPGGEMDSVAVTVDQIATVIEIEQDSAPITLIAPQALLPISCRALDRNGFELTNPPTVTSETGTVQGTSCGDLVAVHSGRDTLLIRSGALEQKVPIALALRPSVGSSLGHPLSIDSFPQGMLPWAPTLIRNAQGDLDLYTTGYFPDPTAPTGYRGDLHRLTSADNGSTFRYDGVALARDTLPCSVNGDGLENVAIVPRAEGSGWRMFYSSGGFTCYGWQIFSAVSPDQRTWTREPGIRVDNGSPQPPQAPGPVPWPAGEGMVLDQLPGGEWRMISGSYERITPAENKFQIVDWRSPDQLTWTYHGVLLSTDDIGPEVNRSIYSPTIREFAPGIYRMIFTGDDLNVPGGRSRLYSAVSLDRTTWQVEGLLMGGAATDLFYSTLVDDLLVFIRADVGQPRSIGAERVLMP